jgi:ABC-type branched-subunit amino acid transport system substrate-binding protein
MKYKTLFAVLFFLASSVLHAQEKEIPIGVLTELSGQFANNGVDCKAGHNAALKAFSDNGGIGGYRVKLIYGDSKGEGKASVSEMNKLLSKNKVFAILANRSQVVMPLNPISKSKKIPLLGVVGHPRFVLDNEYAFRFYPSTDLEGPFLAEKIRKQGAQKLASVGLQDEYLIALQKSTLQRFKEMGGEVVFEENVTEGESDFNALISRLSSRKPDFILANFGLGQSGIFIRKLRERGLRQPLVSSFWVQRKDVIENAGMENIEGTGSIGISSKLPKFGAVLQEFVPGARSSTIYYACHVALAGLLQSIKHANFNINNSTSLFQALNEIQKIELLDETLSIKDREVQFTLEYSVIKNGEVVPE